MSATPQALADKVVDAGDGRIISFPGDMPDEKISSFITNSKPTKFEKDRPGGETLTGTPGHYPEPSMTTGMGSSVWEGVKGLGKGVLSSLDPTQGLSGAGLSAIGLNPRGGTASEHLSEVPIVRAAHEVSAAHHDPVATPAEVPLAGLGSLVGESSESARAHAARGESGAILGEAAVPIGTAVAGELAGTPMGRKAIGAVADTARAIPDKTALALRTEEGALKPGVARTAGALTGAAGAGLGHIVGVPEGGAILGYGLGPSIADRLIPNLPHDIPTKTPIGAHLPSVDEFYQGRAEDLAKRGKEQGAIDKTAEREQTAQEKATAKEGKAVPITQSPYYNQHIEALKAQTEAAQAAKPKIVSPTEGEPRVTGSEGRPATWTNEFVQEQAGKGNRDAISQAVRRGLELPPNARYVMGDPDFPRAVLNPREVTLFSPEGTPIRNKANAQAEAQQGSIPTISRTPRGSIPNIGEGAPKGVALPPAGPIPETSTPLAAKPPAEPVAEPVAAAPATESPTTPGIKPLGPVVSKDRTARLAAAAKRLEQGLQAKQGAIPSIGEGKPSGSAFKVPANSPIVPPSIQEALQDTKWEYVGKNNLGLFTIKEPGTNIRISLFERDLNPSFIRRKIAEKERQFGTPEK